MRDSSPEVKQVLERAEAFRRDVSRLSSEIASVIVGQQPIIDGVLTALIAGGHVLLEGVPGLGKTLLVRTLADAVDLSFARIQFTPDLMPADITGTTVLVEDEGGRRRFEFQEGPVFANLLLADEVNRATPKTQSALLEAMQEQSVTVAHTTHPLPSPFFVLATQNPLEMEGTYPLPEAQLDRFFSKLRVPFPSREALHGILDRTTQSTSVRAEKVLARERLVELRALAREVPVARSVQDFALRILEATHPETPGAPGPVKKFVRYGSSPRGAQALLLGAKIRALLAGRFSVATDDVIAMGKPALRHRLILNFEGQAEGVDADAILDAVLSATPELA